jgi:hypothetical protein
MKKNIPILSLIFFALSVQCMAMVQSANTGKQVTGNKNVVTQDRKVTAFHAIKVSGGIDIELSQGNELKLQVEADENLQAIIHTEVTDGVLNIYHDDNVRDAKTMKIHLTFQSLDEIKASGGCDIESKQKLSFATLKLDLSGGCDIKLNCKAESLVSKQSGGCDADLSGEAENATFDVSGGCDVDAKEFYLKNCTVDASGGSDVTVTSMGALTLRAAGASDITYYGKPTKVTKSATGASDITAK